MTDAAIFYVYLISRLDGQPLYVGKGKGNRWRHHGKYGRNKHLLYIMAQAKAEGRELPRMKIREGLTEDKAFEYERAVIAFFGREDLGTGMLVNLTEGGDGPSGYRYSDEERARHSERMKNRTMSPDWRANVSAGLKGKKKTPEHIAAAAVGQRGSKKSHGWWSTEEGRAKQRQNNPTPFKKGHSHSPETLAKLSASGAAYWAKRRAAEAAKET